MIGEFARTPRFQGAGSSQVNPTKVENALDELTAAFAEVTFAAGYGIGDTGDDERAARRGRRGRPPPPTPWSC